jgi:hypothetical protein
MDSIKTWKTLLTCVVVLISFALPSCRFVEGPLPVRDIEFQVAKERVRRFQYDVPNHEMTLRILGGAQSLSYSELGINFDVRVQFREQLGAIQVFPERVHCSFSDIPMILYRTDTYDSTGAELYYGLRYKCRIPPDLLSDRTRIGNRIVMTFEGFVEYEGTPLAIDTIYAQMRHFDSWLKLKGDIDRR